MPGNNEAVSQVEMIGQRIKRERLDRGMTQRTLAEKVRVGVPHISKIEAGREQPSDELLQRIALVFCCDFDELLIAARRIPQNLLEGFASDPQRSLRYLRQWKTTET